MRWVGRGPRPHHGAHQGSIGQGRAYFHRKAELDRNSQGVDLMNDILATTRK